jgi:alkaline phosphatase
LPIGQVVDSVLRFFHECFLFFGSESDPPFMKLRNQLLALACLLLFIAFGFLYFYKWVEQKPFGIILFVSDNLTTSTITAARLYEGGAEHRLELESFPNLAILSNQANDFAVPDSASAASTLATGAKVNNQAIAVDTNSKVLISILELARQHGRSTGLVTSGNLTDAGVAAFYAHASKSSDLENLALQLTENAKIDVVMGGGASEFTPESKGGFRKDGRDLILELHQKGHEIVRSKAELEGASSFLTSNLAGFFSNGNLAFANKIEAGSQQPSLSDMVQRAIEFLQNNTSGYVLVVDSELGGRASEQNDGEHALAEMIDLDKAIAIARQYAGEKSLVIAAGKRSAGGMSLNGYPLLQDHGVALLGTNPFGYPSITWATGPNGPFSNASSASPVPSQSPPPAIASAPAEKKNVTERNEPAAFYAPVAISNADDMVAVGIGPGSQSLKGFLDNTFIFKLMKDNL